MTVGGNSAKSAQFERQAREDANGPEWPAPRNASPSISLRVFSRVVDEIIRNIQRRR